jgi:hypothetical protein
MLKIRHHPVCPIDPLSIFGIDRGWGAASLRDGSGRCHRFIDPTYMNEKITCRELAVVDEEGREVITLSSNVGHHSIYMGTREATLSLLVVNGQPRITLAREGRDEMYIYSHQGWSEIHMMDGGGLPAIKIRSDKGASGCSIDLFKDGQLEKRITV